MKLSNLLTKSGGGGGIIGACNCTHDYKSKTRK